MRESIPIKNQKPMMRKKNVDIIRRYYMPIPSSESDGGDEGAIFRTGATWIFGFSASFRIPV